MRLIMDPHGEFYYTPSLSVLHQSHQATSHYHLTDFSDAQVQLTPQSEDGSGPKFNLLRLSSLHEPSKMKKIQSKLKALAKGRSQQYTSILSAQGHLTP